MSKGGEYWTLPKILPLWKAFYPLFHWLVTLWRQNLSFFLKPLEGQTSKGVDCGKTWDASSVYIMNFKSSAWIVKSEDPSIIHWYCSHSMIHRCWKEVTILSILTLHCLLINYGLTQGPLFSLILGMSGGLFSNSVESMESPHHIPHCK